VKKTRIWLLLLVGLIAIGWYAIRINSGFATEAILGYNYIDKDISIKITDENDIRALKKVLKGIPFPDSPSCGFTTDVSITMTNGRKSVVFCPACDGCPILRMGASGKYIGISEKARTKLNTVLEKYGMTFPCV